jgi:predicted  nucleic acid-binding Zn-ribbon protein
MKILIIILLMLLPTSTIYAQTKISTSSAKVETKLIKINGSLDLLIEHNLQFFIKLDRLFDKLQTNIIKTKASGKNTKELEALLSDSRVKLADARVRLNEAKTLKETAKTKTDYNNIKTKLSAVKTDLTAIRKNVAKIISILKGYNSNPESTSSAVKM